jgi:hypothetical protein
MKLWDYHEFLFNSVATGDVNPENDFFYLTKEHQ